MYIEKRVRLNNNDYYVVVEVEYRKSEVGSPILCLKNFTDSYWDGGDFSILLEKLEKNYTPEKAKYYDKYIGFIVDVIYLYEHIPFLTAVRDVYISSKDNLPYSTACVSKEEINRYIKEFNISIKVNDNFKLYDQRTWMI